MDSNRDSFPRALPDSRHQRSRPLAAEPQAVPSGGPRRQVHARCVGLGRHKDRPFEDPNIRDDLGAAKLCWNGYMFMSDEKRPQMRANLGNGMSFSLDSLMNAMGAGISPLY
jgi:hypothetical protein